MNKQDKDIFRPTERFNRTLSRRDIVSLDITTEKQQKEMLCPSCAEFGFNRVLGPRYYPKTEQLPADHENWLQCYTCGCIVARIHALHKDSTIVGIIQARNPLDRKPSISSVFDSKDRKNRRKLKR